MVKNLFKKAGNPGSIPVLGTSPGEGNASHSAFVPGEFHGQSETGELQSAGLQRVRHN